MIDSAFERSRQIIVLILVCALTATPILAGVTVTGANGITMTGADGVTYIGTSGITMTGADGLLACGVNGITMTGADGITMTGADAGTYPGPNSVSASRADGITMTGADGITMTGADGITMTGADGTVYQADSVLVTQANGITMTGADGIVMTGADGVARTGVNGITMTGADGITMTGADGITMTGADNLIATGTDGHVFSVPPNGISFTGANSITMTAVNGITMTGADGLVVTGVDGITMTGADATQSGLQSVDPELAAQLNQITDDSNVNAVVAYYHLPTDVDVANLQAIGVLGGTRYQALPMIAVTATRSQIIAISRLPAVRSIYGNRTLQTSMAPPDRAEIGVDRAQRDSDLVSKNGGAPFSGRGVSVAVLDTGVDATHADLAGRVVQNVKLGDTQSVSVGFTPPVAVENVPNTDQAYGHGTFVAGVVAGNGAQSGGKYSGVAPGAQLVGLSAGDLTLSFVLAGFDYLLGRGKNLNVRVVNCSFSANTVFDTNDPVNIATKIMTDNGINVVFSAGNNGPGAHTLNPYAAAPWVVSVGATDSQGRLASFSSRGDFGSSVFHPTLVAPGVNTVSLRSSGASVVGASGLGSSDTSQLSWGEVPYYTTGSGTSFSAPEVAGAIALMLEANPGLTPRQVRDILQRSATPLPPYYRHEVGAGMLNAYAAVLEAAFTQRRMGLFRATMNRGQARFVNDPLQQFSGTVLPGANYQADLPIPQNTLLASVRIAWGPMWSVNNLGLSLYDPSGVKRAESDTLNLPGLMGKRQSADISMPSPGTWAAKVANTLGVAGTPQDVSGTLQITEVQYPSLTDMATLAPGSQSEIYQALRTFVMWPLGGGFRPGFSVSRYDLANSLLLGGRVPQYLPGHPNYTDVKGAATALAIESAQAAPGGALFPDASPGSSFRPYDPVDRLTAAIVLVRAAGLRAEAEAQAGTPLGVADAGTIPGNLSGYVAVALTRSLLTTDGTNFRPQSALTRAELAHAIVVIETLATR